MRQRADRIPARTLLRAVLSGRDPVPRVRYRGRVHVPVGGPLQQPLAHLRTAGSDDQRVRLRRDVVVRRDPRRRTRICLAKEGDRMGVELTTTRLEDAAKWAKQGKLARVPEWGRKFSLFTYPFVTACCGMEFMSVAAPKYDIARFGAEFPRFSPRQSDLLMIVGTITEKQGPALKRAYDQMAEPKWVIAFGVCASTGGFYQNYSAMPGADQVIPVDVYIPGCPPRPEQVLDALMMLMDRIQDGRGHSQLRLKR